jgi:hypothetical protein
MRTVDSNPPGVRFEGPPQRRGLQALAVVWSLLGGSAASVLLFNTGLSLWGLLVGFGLMVSLALGTALAAETPRALAIMLTYLLACSLLIWPVLLVAASGLWGTWE